MRGPRVGPRKGAALSSCQPKLMSVASRRYVRKQCHGQPTLLGREHIRDDTTRIGERRATKRTGEESEYD